MELQNSLMQANWRRSNRFWHFDVRILYLWILKVKLSIGVLEKYEDFFQIPIEGKQGYELEGYYFAAH